MAEKEKDGVIEGQGFIIRDRRQVSQEGGQRERPPDEKKQSARAHQKEESSASSATQQETIKEEAATADQYQDVPLPEVTFANLIFSLVHSAMLALGLMPDPETGKAEKHLSMAKHVIDTIGMLQLKTQGNLTEEEQRLLDDTLFDLRMRFVQEKEKSGEQ